MFDAHFVAVVLLVCALGECQLAGDALLNFGEAPSGPSTSGRSGSEPAGLKYVTKVVQRYFETFNPARPIFNRPLLEKQLLSPDAMQDKPFAAAFFLICALGVGQIAAHKGLRTKNRKPDFFDQIFYLAATYMVLMLGHSSSFSLFGTAVQLASQIRAHLPRSYQQQPNLKDELRKRTFWSWSARIG
ncbi:hypothetical protein BKA62DRAFT_671714 [Auriculariales sp. MPI-PUGE-AT-0066]|nr:hypothetical protein BKA62DRAFT_671714 [Auriculariales sp. MPI-PUGE-AT-0066]